MSDFTEDEALVGGGSPQDDDGEESAFEKAQHACCFSCIGGFMFWLTLAALAYNEKRYVDQETATGVDNHHHYLRIALWLANCMSVAFFFYPLYTAVDVLGDYFDNIPCVGDAVEDAMESMAGCALILVSFAIGTACCLIVFAVAWLAVHPNYGYTVLGIALFLIVAVCVYKCMMPPSEKRLQRQADKGMISARLDTPRYEDDV